MGLVTTRLKKQELSVGQSQTMAKLDSCWFPGISLRPLSPQERSLTGYVIVKYFLPS